MTELLCSDASAFDAFALFALGGLRLPYLDLEHSNSTIITILI